MTRAVTDRAEGAARAPGRPRDPSRDDAILGATMELLASEGFARLSIEGVAHRAGVGKPTVYRRWSSKAALVMDAFERAAPPIELPKDGTVRERLTVTLMEFCRNMRSGSIGKIMAGIVAELPSDPELAHAFRNAYLARRRRVVFELLQQGVDEGELRPDLDIELAADQLSGPFIVRKLVTGGSFGPDLVPKLVDYLFDGWSAQQA
jgi:AcrR family transcriptional regulator